jgi:hypothetical protein
MASTFTESPYEQLAISNLQSLLAADFRRSAQIRNLAANARESTRIIFCFLAIMKFMAGSVRPVQFLNRSAFLPLFSFYLRLSA